MLLESRRGDKQPHHPIDKHTHMRQAAWIAWSDKAFHGNDDRMRKECAVAALFHDVAGGISPNMHGEIAAALLKPYLCSELTGAIRVHDEMMRAHWFPLEGRGWEYRLENRNHPDFLTRLRFSDWDAAAFQPGMRVPAVEYWEPIVEEIISDSYEDESA